MNALELEIRELHQFFEDWFRGAVPDDDHTFARLDLALHPRFTMVPPSGELLSRKAVVEGVRAAYGSGPRNIQVERIEMIDSSGERLTAGYEEWQQVDGVRTARRSTVLFVVDFNATNSLRWLHLQETWMKPPAIDR